MGTQAFTKGIWRLPDATDQEVGYPVGDKSSYDRAVMKSPNSVRVGVCGADKEAAVTGQCCIPFHR